MTTTATPPATRPSPRPSLANERDRRRRGRRRVLRGVLALLLAVLVAGAAWVVYFSSVLDTRVVTVTGAQALTPEQVTTAAAVPLGRPLARPAASLNSATSWITGGTQARKLRNTGAPSTRISTSFVASDRASSASQLSTRASVRFASQRATGSDHPDEAAGPAAGVRRVRVRRRDCRRS